MAIAIGTLQGVSKQRKVQWPKRSSAHIAARMMAVLLSVGFWHVSDSRLELHSLVDVERATRAGLGSLSWSVLEPWTSFSAGIKTPRSRWATSSAAGAAAFRAWWKARCEA